MPLEVRSDVPIEVRSGSPVADPSPNPTSEKLATRRLRHANPEHISSALVFLIAVAVALGLFLYAPVRSARLGERVAAGPPTSAAATRPPTKSATAPVVPAAAPTTAQPAPSVPTSSLPTPPPAPKLAPPTTVQATRPAPGPPPVAELNALTFDRPLFAESSPWNLPASGAVDSLSDAMIENLARWTDGRGFTVNTDRYAIPLYYADSSTPSVRVVASTNWWDGMDAPIPAEAEPDPGDDRHLVVWDVSSDRLYEYWGAFMVRQDVWCAGYGISFDASGAGIQTGSWDASARAYGGSAVAGAIRYGEMKRGTITHALAMAYPGVRGDRFARGLTGIASHSGNDLKPDRTTDANIPLGARLRLKAAVDVVSRCEGNRGCEVIGRALQEYGTFVVDAGGAPVFYAENLIGKSVSWDELLSPHDAKTFVAEDFEVLELPPLTDPPPRDPLTNSDVMYDPPTECSEEP